MSGNHSRRKGGDGEREVQRILRDQLLDAERTFQQIAGDRADIRCPGYAIEVKRVAKNIQIWSALEQADAAAGPTEVPVLAFRRDRGNWYAALPLDELAALIKRGEQ